MNGNRKKLGCGGVLGIIILIFIIFAVIPKSGSSTSSRSASTSTQTKTTQGTTETKQIENITQTSNDLDAPNPTPELILVDEPTLVLSVGDKAQIGSLEFTVKRMVFSPYPGNLQGYGSIDNDYQYCVVYLDVYNPTNETVNIKTSLLGLSYNTDWNVDLIFDGEVNYGHSFGEYTDFFFGNNEIIARATLSDKVLSFKVPANVKDSSDELELIINCKGNDETTWKLR